MAFAASSLVYVDYGERHPTVIHSRLILEHIQDDEYLILTPDFDMYIEQYSIANTDILSYHAALPGGGAPPGITPATIYGFAPITAGQLASFLSAGRSEAQLEKMRRGLIAPGAPAAAAGGGAPAVGANVWVIAEMVDGRKIGERVIPPAGFVRDGVWGLMSLADASGNTRPTLIHEVTEADVPSFCDDRIKLCRIAESVDGEDRQAADDVRTLEVRYGVNNERQRNFRESISELRQTEFEDFPLLPRTTLEYCRAISTIAESATAQHHMWINSAKIGEGDRSIYEDEVLARVIDYALVYDALDISNLACMEVVRRRRQLLADAHAASPGTPSYLGAEHYMGSTFRVGGGVVVPTLSEHVAKKMAAQSAIMKERRKLDEGKKNRPGPKGAPKAGAKGQGGPSQ